MTLVSGVWSPPTSATKKVVPFTGTEKAKFLAYDGLKDDYYGFAVGVSYAGETVAIGAYLDDDVRSGVGSVYIYRKTGTTWAFHQKIIASDALGNDYSGECVAVSGDGNTIVTVVPGDNEYYNSAGAAHVFKNISGTWTHVKKLYPKGTMGWKTDKIAISKDGKAIAFNGQQTGSMGIFVYREIDNDWIEVSFQKSSDWVSGDNLGKSLSFNHDGTMLLAGSPYKNNKGQAYIFN